MTKPLTIALLGCGTVGSGVTRLLLEQAPRLARRARRAMNLKKVLVKNPDKPRAVELPAGVLTTNFEEILNDPEIDVVAELIGGTDLARDAVLKLLEKGKDVVTANKALLALHGAEVFETARRHQRAVAFEASVAGGVPIIAALTQSLAANQILALQAILNGTSNYILTGMTETGRSYDECVKEAQEQGLAEADPTLDVDGTDAAHKLSILAQIAFSVAVPFNSIKRRGIQDVDLLDVRYAGELGYVIKLLAEGWLEEGQLAMHVSPVLLRRTAALAQVRGAFNAIRVAADAVGDMIYYGPGAGQMPTASAVVADLIDLAVGRAQRTFDALQLWSDVNGESVSYQPSSTVRSRFYLRVLADDKPGVLEAVAGVLAKHGISIASVIQHEVPEDDTEEKVQMVVMTHLSPTSEFQAAVTKINELKCLAGNAAYYPVAD